jgi:hypothetical protein
MRREWIQQIEAEADAFICDFGVQAHSVARRWERETDSLIMARVWNRVALIVARSRSARIALRVSRTARAALSRPAPALRGSCTMIFALSGAPAFA